VISHAFIGMVVNLVKKVRIKNKMFRGKEYMEVKMSTPIGHNKLWKNIDWKNAEEKLAFFNHYFRRGHIANDYCKDKIESFKNDVIGFIKEGNIKEKDKERPITMKDVIDYINKI